MDKNVLKSLGKCIAFGLAWTALLFIVALILSKTKGYLLKDVLFIGGILFILLGILSSVGGNSMGLSLQSLGQNNAQFNSSSNLEVSKIEKERTNGISKVTISASISTASLVLAGIFSIVINYII